MPYNRQKVWQTYMGDAERGDCLCCGTEPITKNNFHVGHIEAKAKGGSDDMSNLRPVCGWCNTRMGTKNMVVFQKEKHPNAKAIKVKRVRGAVEQKASKASKKKGLPNATTTAAIVQPHQIIVMPPGPVIPRAATATATRTRQQCYSLFLLIIIIIIVITVTVIYVSK